MLTDLVVLAGELLDDADDIAGDARDEVVDCERGAIQAQWFRIMYHIVNKAALATTMSVRCTVRATRSAYRSHIISNRVCPTMRVCRNIDD